MPYLIDGHNLIGKITHISLSDLDDEQALFNILKDYFQTIRRKAILFFDHASLSSKTTYSSAFVEVHFVHNPINADKAILNKIQSLGGNAKNYTVVTSDIWVSDNALSAGSSVISSEDFAAKLQIPSNSAKKHQSISENDVEYWLNQFQKDS